MGIVIELKEAVLDYKPGQCNPKIRLHALQVYNYLEQIECNAIIPEINLNNITYCDFAVLSKKDEVL